MEWTHSWVVCCYSCYSHYCFLLLVLLLLVLLLLALLVAACFERGTAALWQELGNRQLPSSLQRHLETGWQTGAGISRAVNHSSRVSSHSSLSMWLVLCPESCLTIV